MVELVHRRVDVARHSDIDKENRTVLARSQNLFSLFLAHNIMWRAGGADNDVRLLDVFEELVEVNRRAVEHLGELHGATIRAVAHKNGSSTAPQQVLGGELTHLTGADDKNGFPVEAAKDFFCQFYRGVGYRDRRATDGRFT